MLPQVCFKCIFQARDGPDSVVERSALKARGDKEGLVPDILECHSDGQEVASKKEGNIFAFDL